MRAFLALLLPEEIRNRLDREVSALSRKGGGVRWVKSDLLHLTLKFLGEINDLQEEVLREDLAGVAGRFTSFHLECAGLGVFPRPERPRVYWAGCRGETDRLAGLAAAIEQCAGKADIPPEARPFRGHVTIGRVPMKRGRRNKRNTPGPVLPSLPKECTVYGDWKVERFHLMKSVLTPDGPLYEPIAAFDLGGNN